MRGIKARTSLGGEGVVPYDEGAGVGSLELYEKGTEGALLGFGATLVDAAVTVDDVMVAAAVPSACLMPAVDVGNGVVLAVGGGGAMDDDEGNGTHSNGKLKIENGKRSRRTISEGSNVEIAVGVCFVITMQRYYIPEGGCPVLAGSG